MPDPDHDPMLCRHFLFQGYVAFSARFSGQNRMHYLDFERPIAELEGKIVELRQLAEDDPTMQIDGDVARLQRRAGAAGQGHLCPADALAEGAGGAPSGPAALSAIMPAHLFDEFTPLAGDRAFGEDDAMIAALARFRGRPSPSSARRRATTPRPASSTISAWRCRKAIARRSACSSWRTVSGCRCSRWCDTSGAYPGVAAEERGQAEAIARSTQAGLRVAPFIATIIGEGGRAARSPSPPPTASTCWSIRSIR